MQPPQPMIKRPPLDVYKKIVIVRKPSDSVTYEDSEGNLQTITDLTNASTTVVRFFLHLFHVFINTFLLQISHIFDEYIGLQNPALQSKAKLDIPTPKITLVQTYKQDLPANHEISSSYVRYRKPTPDEIDCMIEYNLDAEDEDWLRSFHTKHTTKLFSNDTNNNSNNTNPLSPRSQTMIPRSPGLSSLGITNSIYPNLTPNTLEIMMDLLEKQTKFDVIPSPSQAHALFVDKIPIVFYTKLPSTTTSNSTGANLNNSTNLASLSVKKAKFISEQVYQYWVNKRCKLKKPLLRKYWPVTASNDTNPHLVFRPREKEKYKLRKKRQNDIDAYRKMQQLKRDYEKIRVLLKLVKDRETLIQFKLKLQQEMFEQRLYDCVDTSGYPRISNLNDMDIQHLLTLPLVPTWIEKCHAKHELASASKKKKRKRSSAGSQSSSNNQHNSNANTAQMYSSGGLSRDGSIHSTMSNASTSINNPGGEYGSYDDSMSYSHIDPSNAFFSHHTDPSYINPLLPPLTSDHRNIPLFTHPLASRQSFVHNWDNVVPFVSSYVDGVPAATSRFKHRSRIGRGGRMVIDRLPYGRGVDAEGNDLEHKVLIVGEDLSGRSSNSHHNPSEGNQAKDTGSSIYANSSRGLLNLLPRRHLDYEEVSHKIKEIVAGYLSEDDKTNNPEEDGEEFLMDRTEWVGMEDGVWGEERFALGPI